MRSCLYQCRVMHHRFLPKEHRFDYRIFFLALDLDELDECHRSLRLFSVNRTNLYSFRESDYLRAQDSGGGLKSRVGRFLSGRGIDLKEGRVLLLTVPRIFGYAFNPVSFYFCYSRDGEPIAAIAEVTNTFREVKCYLLGPETGKSGANSTVFRARMPKWFYVSPYSDVDVEFEFYLRPPEEGLALRIDDFESDRRTLTSTLAGPRRKLTDLRLLFFTVSYPLMTLQVIFLIHWHAFRLWLKRIPWFAKDARMEDQRSLVRPDGSISPP